MPKIVQTKSRVTNSLSSLGPLTYHIIYTDGSSEHFSQGTEPDVGWVETLDIFGVRTGWIDSNGTAAPLKHPWYFTSTTTTGSATFRMPQTRIYDDYVKFTVQETCTKCKETVFSTEIEERYNWCSEEKLERRICKKCYARAMDKLLGMDNNIDAEITLFDKKKK